MTFDVTLQTEPMTLEADMGEVVEAPDYDVEDGIITKTLAGAYRNDRVTTIGYTAFANFNSLVSVSFPSVTSTSNSPFQGCRSLRSADFPSATGIGNNAFQGCAALTDVNLPKLKFVPYAMCDACLALTRIDLPAATDIVNEAFTRSPKLETVILRHTGGVCSLSHVNAFGSTPIASGTGYVYVPDELVESYKTATNWATYAAQIKPLSELEG